MQFIQGALTTVAFFCCLAMAYSFGQRSKQAPTTPIQPKAEDEEAIRKAKRMREGFEQLMSYDVTVATRGKKVKE